MSSPVVPAKPNIPNCITSARIAGTVVLLFLTPLTPVFLVLYTLCGISDVLDGWIARKTNSISEFGSKLDSIADLIFYALMIIRLLPVLWRILPLWFWYIVGGIVFLRFIAYLTAAVKYHRFAALHTRMNKITGAAMFLLPYFLALPFATAYCFIVMAVACISSVEELVIHITHKEYHPNTKALF